MAGKPVVERERECVSGENRKERRVREGRGWRNSGPEEGDERVEMGTTGRWVRRERWVFRSKLVNGSLSSFCEY